MCIYKYTTIRRREDERGGWVVSSDLDPGNQVSSSQLEVGTHSRGSILLLVVHDLPRWPNLRPRRVTIARITSELSRPRQPVNRGRVTVIIETLLRDRTRRMESQPTPLLLLLLRHRDGWKFSFFFTTNSILFFFLIVILDSALKVICRETNWSRFRFWKFGWSVSRNLSLFVGKKKNLGKPDLGYPKRRKKKREKKEGIPSMNATMISRFREKEREREKGNRRGKNLSRSFYLERDYVMGSILLGEEQPFIRGSNVGSMRRYNS